MQKSVPDVIHGGYGTGTGRSRSMPTQRRSGRNISQNGLFISIRTKSEAICVYGHAETVKKNRIAIFRVQNICIGMMQEYQSLK
jgi:hypothetical protein